MQQLTLFETTNTLPIEYYPGFLHSSEAEALYTHCKALQWRQNEIRMLGKPLQVPRLERSRRRSASGVCMANQEQVICIPIVSPLKRCCGLQSC
jgi:hypothetical protein